MKNKGITLVALVITIIILLILAGITIMQLTQNGTFEKAKQAKEIANNASQNEEEELKKLENSITQISATRENTGKTTILYPDGTEQEPAILNPNQRIEIDNPYPGHRVYCVAEFYINEHWGDTGFVIYNSYGYGTSASQLTGKDYDKIIVQSGNSHVVINSEQGGGSLGTNDVSSAPYRVVVTCLD